MIGSTSVSNTLRLGTAVMALVAAPLLLAAEIVPGRIDPPRTPRHHGAMEAGHTALFLCSGLFGSGLTRDVVERDAMLAQIDRESLPEELSVEVDEARKAVLVRYLPEMPPRIAAWRRGLGCAQLPIGASPDAIRFLPTLPDDAVAPELDDAPWPLGDRGAKARIAGSGTTALTQAIEAAFDSDAYGGVTWGVVVVKDGQIVGERYQRGYHEHALQRTHSAIKSVAATVIGVAVEQGLLDLDAPAPIPEWRRPADPRGRITLTHLLHMGSGLYTEGGANPQQEIYLAGAPVAERSVVGVVDAPPGTRYVYAGSDTLLSIRALRVRLADDERYLRFPYQELLWKIGMTRTVIETDWNGDYLMSGQAYASARDLARLGLLYLNDGVWQGERLLPEGWGGFVATPAPAQPAGSWANEDCAGECTGRAYGAQFWIPDPDRGVPAGSYMASGGRGQYMLVVPDRNVVIVRRGTDLSRRHVVDERDRRLSRFDLEQFAADVLKALDDVEIVNGENRE